MNPQQHTCKTTFAGNRNPFTGAYMPKNPPRKHADPDTMEICNDPIPSYRAKPKGKYDEMFAKLKPGQCIKCKPDESQKLAHAMRGWAQDHAKTCVVRSISDYGDGMGRVWLIAGPVKALKAA